MKLQDLTREWHGVEIESPIPEHVFEWLDTTVGKEHWFRKGIIGGNIIYFDSEKNHFLFLMKWGK